MAERARFPGGGWGKIRSGRSGRDAGLHPDRLDVGQTLPVAPPGIGMPAEVGEGGR